MIHSKSWEFFLPTALSKIVLKRGQYQSCWLILLSVFFPTPSFSSFLLICLKSRGLITCLDAKIFICRLFYVNQRQRSSCHLPIKMCKKWRQSIIAAHDICGPYQQIAFATLINTWLWKKPPISHVRTRNSGSGKFGSDFFI